MQVLTFLHLPVLAGDDENVRFMRDIELMLVETGDSDRHPILVLADSLDVIGRPVVYQLRSAGFLEKVEQAVEADA